MWSGGQADDKARFLADLRVLRDAAAIGYDELSARTHFPSDVLKEAENGPTLPTLPILAAYVRACDGDVPAWEERWRQLGSEAWTDPNLPVRPAGASPAAAAGARAGVSMAPPDAYDPARIKAALRGGHERSDTAIASRGMTAAAPSAIQQGAQATDAGAVPQGAPGTDSPASWSTRTGWDDTPPHGSGVGQAGWSSSAGDGWHDGPNGHGPDASSGWGTGASQEPTWDNGSDRGVGRGWDARQGPDVSSGWDARQGQGVSSGWDGGASQAERGWFDAPSRNGGTDQYGGSGWDSGQNGDAAHNWTAAADAGANGNHHGGQDDVPFGGAATVTPDLSSAPESIYHDPFSSSWLQDSELTAPPGPGTQRPESADTQSAAQNDSSRPASSQDDDGRLDSVTVGRPHGAETVAAAAGARAPQASRAVAEAPAKVRSDRYYPLRLVLVIVVAALIGSVLVLLLR